MKLPTIHLPHDARQAQGSWWIDGNASPPCVRMSCPECGAKADLAHAVDSGGVVFPSVKCPGQVAGIAVREGSQDKVRDIVKVPAKPPCGFHASVVLVGWPNTWSIADV